MSKTRIPDFESVVFDGFGRNSSEDEDDGDLNVLTSDIVHMKAKLRRWVIKHLISGDALKYLLKILEDCNILSPKEAHALKKSLASSAYNGGPSGQTNIGNDSNLPFLLREMKSIKQAIQYSLQKQEQLAVSQMEEFISFRQEMREVAGLEKSVLPKMPFNNRQDFENFNKELQQNTSLLNEFKRNLSFVSSDNVGNFGRACMRKLMTDELLTKYVWKNSNTKPKLNNMFVMSVIRDIAQELMPDINESRINNVLQAHVIHARDRLGKRGKTMEKTNVDSELNETSTIEGNEEETMFSEMSDSSMPDALEQPFPDKVDGPKRKRVESTPNSAVKAMEDDFLNLSAKEEFYSDDSNQDENGFKSTEKRADTFVLDNGGKDEDYVAASKSFFQFAKQRIEYQDKKASSSSAALKPDLE